MAEQIEPKELALSFMRAFGGEDGKHVLDPLRHMTLNRALGPDVTTEHLRHLEGQRFLVAYIDNQIQRGKNDE